MICFQGRRASLRFVADYQQAINGNTRQAGSQRESGRQGSKRNGLCARRALVAAQALREGMSVAEIHAIAKFDPWFLERLEEIVAAENDVKTNGLPNSAEALRRLKAMGFSDKRLAYLALESVNIRPGMETAVRRGSGIAMQAASQRMEALGRQQAALGAKQAALAAVKPGITGHQLDQIAQQVLSASPYAAYTGEGIGHGVGLALHEYPLMRRGCMVVLPPGMVITIEPGLYKPGFGGVRIEDDVLITKTGCRILTKAAKTFELALRE